jgi:hypothetical protein
MPRQVRRHGFRVIGPTSRLSDNALEPRLEPFDRIILANLMAASNLGLRSSPFRNPRTRPSHAAVEVHPIDTDRGVILDAQINVFRDAEAEVAGIREVLLAQFVLLDLQATFEDFLGLGASDGNVYGDLLVAADAEGADGVASFACAKLSEE